jgi:hypothetical protein
MVVETQLTQRQQEIRDEHTVFSLAVLAMDMHMYASLKNKALMANAFMKVGIVIRNNPGFPERFKKAQMAIAAASGPQPTEAPDLVSANPPPSLL